MYIKPLSPDAAFTKGVEYFSEIFFFYGMLMAIALYEIKRNHDSSIKATKQLKKYEDDIGKAKDEI